MVSVRGRENRPTMSKPRKIQQQSYQVQQTSFQGPLPKPSDFAQYETILPGAAERIISMAERQAVHRQAIEKKVIGSDALHALVGTACGLVIGLFGLGVAGYCIINGHDLAGAVIGGATLASMVSAFIYGSSKRRRER